MEDISVLLDDPGTSIAVVGATDTPGKYGGKVYRDLKAKGFAVTPVNPSRKSVDGDPARRSIEDLDAPPDLAVFVVPPTRTAAIIEQQIDPGKTAVWLQPGAEDPGVLRLLDRGGFRYVAGSCVMVHSHAHV